MERNKIVKATFYSQNKKQLDFLINALARAVGKENITYLTPKYYAKSGLLIMDMDIKIPDTLLHYQNITMKEPSSNDKAEEER